MAKLGTYVSNKDLECKIYGEKIEFKIVKSEKKTVLKLTNTELTM